MAAAPTKWTDERLDDAADRLARFEADVKDRFDKVDARFDKVDGGTSRLNRDVPLPCTTCADFFPTLDPWQRIGS
jgi:hypothetical protein